MCSQSHVNAITSLNASTPSQRAATLRLSSPTEHQSNYYDVLRGDDPADELRWSYDRPRTSCCDDDQYLTPAQVISDTWTTATMPYYNRPTNNGGYEVLTDSGKFLQLQDSACYDYI